MVLGEIGKDGGMDNRAGHAQFFDADGRSLHRACLEPLLRERTQGLLQENRIRRREACGLQCRRATNAQRADDATRHSLFAPHLAQCLCQPPGSAGFSVGAGHSHHGQLAGRHAIKRCCYRPRTGLESGVKARAIGIQFESLCTRLLREAGESAFRQCGRNKAPWIGRGTRPGNECIHAGRFATVCREALNAAGTQPFHGLRGGCEGGHQKLSSTASATICGCTAMSG